MHTEYTINKLLLASNSTFSRSVMELLISITRIVLFMHSLFLAKLNPLQRDELLQRLWDSQKGMCFICEQEINLKLHKDTLDIDHVEPLKNGGKDDQTNFALTHLSCNRSKQASDLRVARVLAQFDKINKECSKMNRIPNLDDIFKKYGGAKYDLKMIVNEEMADYSFPELKDNTIHHSHIYKDDLSGMQYFFAKLPISYLFHDDRINPRSIGSRVSGLVGEFFKKRPQLSIALGWISTTEQDNNVRVKVFDGQHKVAAQVLLGVKEIPIRIFINPDPEVLITTNTNAGTKYSQVAFDKSVQRHLGSSIYRDRVRQYQREHGLGEEDYSFSEKDLVRHFKGDSREMKKDILDSTRDEISHNTENKLMAYVDFAGRAKEKPISYSTIEKTFYSFFIYKDLLESLLSYTAEGGENPRDLEKSQIIKLMNIIADEIYVGKFDFSIGTNRIESNLQKGEQIPEDHLIAYRLSREEVLYNWLYYVRQIVKNYFIMLGNPINEEKLFQYRFPEPLWEIVRIFIHNLKQLPVWVNHELSASAFGGKQNNAFWQTIFETGKSPSGQQVLSSKLNLMDMIKE